MNQIKKNANISYLFGLKGFFASLGYETKVAKNI